MNKCNFGLFGKGYIYLFNQQSLMFIIIIIIYLFSFDKVHVGCIGILSTSFAVPLFVRNINNVTLFVPIHSRKRDTREAGLPVHRGGRLSFSYNRFGHKEQ